MHQQAPNYDESILELLEKAEDCKFQGQFETAIETLQKIIIAEPGCNEAFEEIGDNYLSLRELKKAEKALKQALKIKPSSANAHYLMGFLFSLQEMWDKSVKELEQADHMFPNHPEILRCLGWSFYNSNRKAQGIAVLERSVTLNPDDVNVLCDLGVCYMNSAQYDKARRTFERIVKLDPSFEQAWEYIKILKTLNIHSSDT